jgi:TonB family protein
MPVSDGGGFFARAPGKASLLATVVTALCTSCASAPATDHRTTPNEAAYISDVKTRVGEHIRSVVYYDPELRCRYGRPLVWFVIDREGHVEDEGITRSSSVDDLDRVALRIVRQTPFRPMTDDLWSGKPDERFAIGIDFVPRADCPA